MEPFVLPKQLLCRLSLNTTWLVMHSPYLGHLRERLADGSRHASAVKQGLCMPPSVLSLSTQLLVLVYLDIR